MARIDKGLIILVGRDRENPRTHRDAFQITGGLGEVLDKHIKRNNLNKSEFIREAIAAKLEAEMPKEPLIKDEKVRKAVRAWARENLIEKVGFKLDRGKTQCACYFYDESCEVCEFGLKFYLDIEHNKVYTIDELCGEEEE